MSRRGILLCRGGSAGTQRKANPYPSSTWSYMCVSVAMSLQGSFVYYWTRRTHCRPRTFNMDGSCKAHQWVWRACTGAVRVFARLPPVGKIKPRICEVCPLFCQCFGANVSPCFDIRTCPTFEMQKIFLENIHDIGEVPGFQTKLMIVVAQISIARQNYRFASHEADYRIRTPIIIACRKPKTGTAPHNRLSGTGPLLER